MRMSYQDFSTLTVLPVQSPKSRFLECIFVSVLGVSDVSKYWGVHIFLFYLILRRCYDIGVSSGNQQRHNMIAQAKLLSWWRHQMETFSTLLVVCAGNSPPPVNSPHKGQWRGALMFSLIYAGIKGWVNNREAGDLRSHRAHYDVIVMSCLLATFWGENQWYEGACLNLQSQRYFLPYSEKVT